MSVFALLVLVAPLLVLASVVATLWTYGPLGWLASVLLVAGLVRGCTWSCRATARWWRSTKAPEQVPVRPADRRRGGARAPG